MLNFVLQSKRKSASVSRLSLGYDNVDSSRATQRSHGPSVCNLCGTVGAVVECEKCQSMAFCSTCDDMYHRHPKRRFHLRKSLLCDKSSTQTRSGIDLRSIAGRIFSKSSNETKPAINASFAGMRDAAAHPSKMPIPPPRRKKKDATLQRGMIPNIMQKFGSSNFRKFQLNESSKKNPLMQQQTNPMLADVNCQRSPVRAESVHQISAPFNDQRRSSFQSLTGSDISSDPWCQESQYDCIPPPLPQKMRSTQSLGRRNLSLTNLCDNYNEPNINPYYPYPQPQFMPPWMHSSLAHSIDDFGDDDDQNSMSEYSARGTLTRTSSRNNGKSSMRRAQSFMQINPWAIPHYPPYYYYPPFYPPPPPQFYSNQGSPPASLRSVSIRRQREDDRASNVSVSVRDSASVRSENIVKERKTKVSNKPKTTKSLVNVQVQPMHSYDETRRMSRDSLTRDISDSEEASENESDEEQEEEEEEEEKYESFSEEYEEEDLLSHGSLVDLSTEWTCKYCTFVNRPERDICDVCAKSNAKRLAMKKQLEDQSTKNESKIDDKKDDSKSMCAQKASVSDTNIVITKEMIDEQKRVEREIRRRILNEKRIARENERIEKREQQKMRRKTLGSIEERGMVTEAVKAIDQKTKSEEKIPVLPLSATIDNNNATFTESLPEFGSSPKEPKEPTVDNLSTKFLQGEVKKKKDKKVMKKVSESSEKTQSSLKAVNDSSVNQSEPVASVNESLSKMSLNANISNKNCQKSKQSTKSNGFSFEVKTSQISNDEKSNSINQTNHLKNDSQTAKQTLQTIHYESKEQQPIKSDIVLQIPSYTESVQWPQPQQQSPQPFTPPPMFPQQMNSMNTTLQIHSPQQQYASQSQLYTSYQDTRRASLGSLPYAQISPMSPSFSVPNSSFDMQLNNQYVSPPPQFVGSMNRIDQVATGGMNAFGSVGSPTPMENYGGYTQQLSQNNYNQMLSRNDINSLTSNSVLGNHFQSNIKSGFEVLKVLREAEKKGFTAEDVEIAFNFSPENAMEWLEINWSNMIETVLTLGNNQVMQNEKKRGVSKKALLQIPLITECEAKEALRNARGNIWQAIEKCVQRKEERRQSDSGNESGSKAKSFTLKISELGAGRDNFDENRQRSQQTSRAEEENNIRLSKIEQMVESWKKDLIEGKKSKEEFLNTIEDLVKQKIAFIDATLARQKSTSLEEEVRKRFIDEFFSDEELDENLFVREDSINVVDEKGNVVCVKDAYKEAGSELSKEELTKIFRDKGFFIGTEKSSGDRGNEGDSDRVQNAITGQIQYDESNALKEMNATLKQSLDGLDGSDRLDTNERTDITDTRVNTDQSDATNIAASESNSQTESNLETKTEQSTTHLNVTSAEVEQSVGENEDKFEDAKEHITPDDLKVKNDRSVDNVPNNASEIELKAEIIDSSGNVAVANKIEEKHDLQTVNETSIDESSYENVVDNDEKKVSVADSTNSESVKRKENNGPPGTTQPRKTYECELCAGNFRLAEMVTMPSCEHSACIECLQQYFTVQIREKQKVIIPCPYCNQPDISPEDDDAICNYLSILDQLLKVLLPDDLHELFQRKVRDRTLQKDPSFRWCSQCSSGFLACDPNAKTITCPDCKAVTCSQCKSVWQKQHIGISCEKFAEWKKANDPKFAEQFIDNHLRQFGIDCPQCKFHYELARGGCIHFHCVQCGHDFCGFCQMPFKMGDKCNQSEWCKKLGFHAHHPRNCLFYLRDRDVNDLKKLLDMHKIKYVREIKETSKKKKQCPVMEQKWKIGEPQAGLIDASCGKELFSDGMCKSHYVEYLTELIRANKVDPVDILDEDEMVHLLRRSNIKIPIKINPKQHIVNLRQVIKEELPLC